MLRTLLNTATFGVLALVLMTGAGNSLASSAPDHAGAAAEVIADALDGVQTLIADRMEEERMQEERMEEGRMEQETRRDARGQG